jgi:hypothetical protein
LEMNKRIVQCVIIRYSKVGKDYIAVMRVKLGLFLTMPNNSN